MADILALGVGHIMFISKYRLPYQEIFTSFFPSRFENYSTILGIVSLIVAWLFAFYISGHYSNTARKSGLQIIGPTLTTSFVMSVILFFLLASHSPINIQNDLLNLSLRYLAIMFSLSFILRMIIISRLHYLIKVGKRGYKSVLIGTNNKALEIMKEFNSEERLKSLYIGYIEEKDPINDLRTYLPCIGNTTDIDHIVRKEEVDEALVCMDQNNQSEISLVVNALRLKEIVIRLTTGIIELIEGTVKTQNLKSQPFITIGLNKPPIWQQLFKRSFDFSLASFALILSAPLYIPLAIAVKIGSDGPILYKQQRIGKGKKPFMILKLRSMYVDAEKNGPALSSANDVRITPIGRFMRKWRLDEIPQLINVISGDMSFVGPRPERQFFIDQILPKAPHYNHLFIVRPGITSWGMVKFGYAENIDQMIERLQYDILYLENRTLVVDFKILLLTLRTLFLGEGK
ncbi:sugar transferase [Labilibacter marinus]|uniref:sugar transferase n=1 Tax=Labilibacter marinus TaxID=1477105 RepID=UPI00082C383B|nr:sugar transferase [Labilibacter marinus]